MCGIAGIIDYSRPSEFYRAPLTELRRRLHHRGPDDSAAYFFPHASLVNTRLSLVDFSAGKQPFVSANGRWAITYNGEVYNFEELRKELAAVWDFKTRSDTEVVLAAWTFWGETCLKKLNGMFAFFVWDNQKEEGFLGRDMVGVKPVAYIAKNDFFAFASEAKALVKTFLDRPRANHEAIFENIVVPCFSGVSASPFKDIHYLQPGHYLRINRDGLFVKRWIDYILDIDDAYRPDLKQTLQHAVINCLKGDVPVGLFLSGGLDSTAIAALAGSSAKDMRSWTICFDAQDQFNYAQSAITISDDTPHARKVAEDIHLKWSLVPVSKKQLLDSIDEIAVINDALPAWEQEFAQHFLSANAAKDVKAVLVGDAADETHYGYPFLLDEEATRTPRNIFDRFTLTGAVNKENFPDASEHFDQTYKKLSFDAGYCWDTPVDRTLATTYLIVKRWLPRLLLNGDMHSMHFGLECRVPFADTALIDQARRIHPNTAFQAGKEKLYLRNCLNGHIPESIRLRPKSALPKDQNMGQLWRERLKAVLKTESADFLKYFFDMDYLAKLAASTDSVNEKQQALMFRTLCLAAWQKHYGVAL